MRQASTVSVRHIVPNPGGSLLNAPRAREPATRSAPRGRDRRARPTHGRARRTNSAQGTPRLFMHRPVDVPSTAAAPSRVLQETHRGTTASNASRRRPANGQDPLRGHFCPLPRLRSEHRRHPRAALCPRQGSDLELTPHGATTEFIPMERTTTGPTLLTIRPRAAPHASVIKPIRLSGTS
jgi:hypothetical protein